MACVPIKHSEGKKKVSHFNNCQANNQLEKF